MANDDPYLKAGREEAAGTKSSTSTAAEDPYVKAGRAEATSVDDLGRSTPDVSGAKPLDWTWAGLTRNVAAAGPRIGADYINLLSDPFANLVGRPLLTVGQAAYDFLAPKLGYPQLTDEQRNALYADFADQPGTRAISAVGNAVGVDPYNVPGTPFEKRVGTAVEGAGTGAAFGGPAAAIPGAAGATLGQIASENVAPWAAPITDLLGNVVGAKLGNITTNIGTRAVGAMTGAKTPVAAAYDELGIDKSLLGDISGDPTARLVQAYASKSPFGSSTVNPVEQRVVGQFNKAVEDTANRLGTSTSEQTAGEVLQREARNWRDNVFPQREAAAWQPVDAAMANESVAPVNYRGSLGTINSRLAALPETQLQLLPARTRALLDAINVDVPVGGTMTWQQARALKTALGGVMGVPEIVQAVGKDQLTRAYAGISQDLANSANGAGQGAAFADANRVSTEGNAFIENTLSKIIRSNNPAQETIAPERATSSVLGSGDTTLQAIRREMPTAANELAAYKLRDMALATPGAAGRTGQETSVGTFLTDLNRMRQQAPGGFAALFSDPTVARRIDALATVADTMKETARRANVAGTGPYLALGEMGGAVIPTWLATQNPWLTAGSVTLPYLGNKAAGAIATNRLLSRLGGAPGADTLNPLALGLITSSDRMNNPLLPR